ncbi:hypothetical protein BDZ91DRAFT_12713 [Kalaharituber pfeilii]|nr:hypothetical protein BDZ91DRAFT_12713 [Kalaharituber pfeilii]
MLRGSSAKSPACSSALESMALQLPFSYHTAFSCRLYVASMSPPGSICTLVLGGRATTSMHLSFSILYSFNLSDSLLFFIPYTWL